jgi:Flp pilus assembly protein TadG
MKGQALAEFALVLPLLLTMTLGAAGVGLLEIERYELQHAATEGAIAGASDPSEPARCDRAVAVAESVLARTPVSRCTTGSGILELSLTEDLPFPVPFVGNTWTVSVVARAAIR